MWPRPLTLEPAKAVLPRDEVVDLLEIDPAAVEAELSRQLLGASSADGVQIFVATNASARSAPSASAEDGLRRPYIGEESTTRAAAANEVDNDVAAPRLAVPANVEDLPGAEPDDGHLPTALTEPTSLPSRHGTFTPCRRDAPRRARARARADRRARGRRELPRRLAARPARGAAPPAGDLRLRAARGQPRRRGRGRPQRAARRARARARRLLRGAADDHAPAPATIAACSLPREPFARLIEANRIDQRTTRYETWDDVREYCTYSAEPVGRLVLGIYGRAGEPELVARSDDVCTGLQLVNFLQDPPRDLALGRVYLPQEDLRRFARPRRGARRAAGASAPPRSARSRRRGRGPARAGLPLAARARRPGGSLGRALRSRRARRARRARARRLGRLLDAGRPRRGSTSPG